MRVSDFSFRIATLLVITPLISFSQAGQTGARRAFNLFSPKQEIEIGRQSAIAVEKRLPLLSDAGVNEYVNRLGRALDALWTAGLDRIYGAVISQAISR